MTELIIHPADWLYYALYLIYAITIIGTIIVVILENRNPVKSIAWIVVLISLPFVGLIFYLFFGQDFRRHRMISRKSKRKLRKGDFYPAVEISKLNLSEDSKQIIRLCSSMGQMTFYPDNEVEIFISGKEKFERLIQDINRARKYIHIQYYIFENDKLGNKIRDLLIARAKEGIEIRVIYDDVGCWQVKNRFFNEMKTHGIEVYPFLEVTFPSLANRINYRNHRKLVVIDGKVGYIGGLNIADRYMSESKLGFWRDTHARITGPAVHGLQASFSVDWSFIRKELLAGPDYFPPTTMCGNTGIQIVTSGPIGQWSNIALGFLRAISNAKRYLYIQTPYFLPTEALLKVMQTAALSKVDVRLMIPDRSDSTILRLATFSYVSQMLKAGVKVYLYQGGFLHAKTIVSDDEFFTIGSTNLDFRSFEHNFEGNAFMYDKEKAIEMKEIFFKDLENCQRIKPSVWRRRPTWEKFKESVVRLMSPVL